MLTITHCYKIKPTLEQIAIVEQNLETCRQVWNYALVERQDWLNRRKSPINACSIKSE
jgi:putative transposase